MKKLEYINIDKIKLYENNPRENYEAIDIIVQSIRQCGYIAPIIVDEDYIILAGHTRYQALKRLGYSKVEVLIIDGLSDEQKRKYRLLDNRTAEFSMWDFDKLETELQLVNFGDFNFNFDDFIFKVDDYNKDNDFIEDDENITEDKNNNNNKIKPTKKKFYKCPHCGKEFEV